MKVKSEISLFPFMDRFGWVMYTCRVYLCSPMDQLLSRDAWRGFQSLDGDWNSTHIPGYPKPLNSKIYNLNGFIGASTASHIHNNLLHRHPRMPSALRTNTGLPAMGVAVQIMQLQSKLSLALVDPRPKARILNTEDEAKSKYLHRIFQ